MLPIQLCRFYLFLEARDDLMNRLLKLICGHYACLAICKRCFDLYKELCGVHPEIMLLIVAARPMTTKPKASWLTIGLSCMSCPLRFTQYTDHT